jgi:hypothetical protein
MRTRIRSGRGYRAIIDQAIADTRTGKISSAEGLKLTQMAKMGYELLLQEQVAAAQGVAVIESDFYPEGDDGGDEVTVLLEHDPQVAVEKTITLKRGVDGEGNATEEQTVVLRGGNALTADEAEQQAKASTPKLQHKPGSLAPRPVETDPEVEAMVRTSKCRSQ